jgi:hypothetical protein
MIHFLDFLGVDSYLIYQPDRVTSTALLAGLHCSVSDPTNKGKIGHLCNYLYSLCLPKEKQLDVIFDTPILSLRVRTIPKYTSQLERAPTGTARSIFTYSLRLHRDRIAEVLHNGFYSRDHYRIRCYQ